MQTFACHFQSCPVLWCYLILSNIIHPIQSVRFFRKSCGSIMKSFNFSLLTQLFSKSCNIKKNHESVRKMAELTIKHCNHALCLAQFGPSWAILYTQYTTWQLFVIHFTKYLAFQVSFTISAPVNGGMSDWFICAKILK